MSAETQKPRAIVFVDYEHWYFSMTNNFGIRPNVRAWRDKLAEQFTIEEILFFADFSHDALIKELFRLREVSNLIIETRSADGNIKKDYTDFIILDNIYQRAFSSDIENFILFTGDGHFSSVVSFLRNRCNKQVGIYGVRQSCSNQLKAAANWYVELSDEEEKFKEACSAIISNFQYIEQQKKRGRIIRPTFYKTAENVANFYNIDSELAKDALSYLLNGQYIVQVEERISIHQSIKVLQANWAKIQEDPDYKVE